MRRGLTGRCAVAAIAAIGTMGLASGGASAAVSSFSGSCTFTGPITPVPGITILPHPGAYFSYAGTGTCNGTLDGSAVTAAPLTVTFTNVKTFFDTCEIGPDFNLRGTATIGDGDARDAFAITISLLRLAVGGPFVLSAGGGSAFGVATFTPPNTATAVTACASTGVSIATLGGNFSTVSALNGTSDPAAAGGSASGTAPAATAEKVSGAHRRRHARARHRHHRRHRHGHHRHHRRGHRS